MIPIDPDTFPEEVDSDPTWDAVLEALESPDDPEWTFEELMELLPSDLHQAVVEMTVIGGLSHPEKAAILGKSVGWVQRLWSQSISILKGHMDVPF